MISEYINASLSRAHYNIIENEEPFHGEVPELKDKIGLKELVFEN